MHGAAGKHRGDMNTVMTAILGGIGTLILASLLASLKWLLSIKQTVEKVHTNDVRRARQMGALFKTLLCNTKATRATLEVVTGIKNNGNVKEAIEHLDAGDKIIEEFNADTAWT
jgi:uncharacterized protein YpmB